MGALADYLKAESDHLRVELAEQQTAAEEWRACLLRLYDTLAGWLREADAGQGLVAVNTAGLKPVREPRLGERWLETMTILIGDRRVEIEPRARFVVAAIRPPGRPARRADGMVQIMDGAVADYYLFRWKQPDGDEWFIRRVSDWNADAEYGRVEPLDRDRFEAAVLSMVR